LQAIGNKEEEETKDIGQALQLFATEVLDYEAGQAEMFFVPEALAHDGEGAGVVLRPGGGVLKVGTNLLHTLASIFSEVEPQTIVLTENVVFI